MSDVWRVFRVMGIALDPKRMKKRLGRDGSRFALGVTAISNRRHMERGAEGSAQALALRSNLQLAPDRPRPQEVLAMLFTVTALLGFSSTPGSIEGCFNYYTGSCQGCGEPDACSQAGHHGSGGMPTFYCAHCPGKQGCWDGAFCGALRPSGIDTMCAKESIAPASPRTSASQTRPPTCRARHAAPTETRT